MTNIPPPLPQAKKQTKNAMKLLVWGGIILGFLILFVILFWKPIDIVTLKEVDFVQYIVDNRMNPKIRAKVSYDSDSNIIISIDGIITDPVEVRSTFEKIRSATTDYIREGHPHPRLAKREAQPFIIKAQNTTILIP